MKKRVILFLFLTLLIVPTLSAQKVTRRIRQLVLINTDAGIGRLNDKVPVFRKMSTGPVKVGLIQIREFRKGKTAGFIVKEYGNYQIKVGDFVQKEHWAEAISPGQASREMAITHIKNQFALLDGDAGSNRVQQKCPIYRQTAIGEILVGNATVMKSAQGKTAIRIDSHTRPYTVRVGDYVKFSEAKTEGDIDYYFFEGFPEP